MIEADQDRNGAIPELFRPREEPPGLYFWEFGKPEGSSLGDLVNQCLSSPPLDPSAAQRPDESQC